MNAKVGIVGDGNMGSALARGLDGPAMRFAWSERIHNA